MGLNGRNAVLDLKQTRYGTLPKNARIGAYLESLRKSGLQHGVMPTNDDSMLPDHPSYDYDGHHNMMPELMPPQHYQQYAAAASRDLTKDPFSAAMIRSNSTQGSFVPQSPLLSRLSPRGSVQQRSDRERRGHTKDLASIAANHHTPITHLEFPPPPSDLPPPPDDFLEDMNAAGNSLEFPPPPSSDLLPSSPEPRQKFPSGRPLPSPRSRRKDHTSSHRSSNRPDRSEYDVTAWKTDESVPSPQPERAPFSVMRRRLKDSESKRPPVKAKPLIDANPHEGVDTSDGSPASRFGVNLRHRDQSSDSCDSVKSCENLSPRSAMGGSKSNWSLTRSPGSSSAETIDTPPSPSVNTTENNEESRVTPDGVKHQSSFNGKNRNQASLPQSASSRENLDTDESVPDTTQAGQLVSELFESLRQKTGPPPPDNGNVKPPPTPTDGNLNSVKDKNSSDSPVSYLSNLRKSKPSGALDRSEEAPSHPSIDFKSKLRKTDTAKAAAAADAISGEGDSHIVDFRSQLRRTNVAKEENGSAKESGASEEQQQQLSLKNNVNYSSQVDEEEMNKKNCYDDGSDHRNSIDGGSATGDKRDSANSDSLKAAVDDDPKRFSSSSISNLKKLWEKEEKEGGGGGASSAAKTDPNQTSPKYAPGLYQKPEFPKDRDQASMTAKTSPDGDKVGKLERRVWPPPMDGKPTVPTKPSVKNLRPPPPSGGGVKLPPPKPGGIYATPSFIKQPSTSSKKDKDGSKMSRSCIEFNKSKSQKNSESSKDADPAPSKKKHSSKVSNVTRRTESCESNGNESDSNGDASATERGKMLDETKKIEESVTKTLSSGAPLSSAACIQLVMQLEQFHMWCSGYVDHMPPQNRFQVLEMLSRLDTEIRQLRVKGGSRSPDHGGSGAVGASDSSNVYAPSKGSKIPKAPSTQYPQIVTTVKDICATLRR